MKNDPQKEKKTKNKKKNKKNKKTKKQKRKKNKPIAVLKVSKVRERILSGISEAVGIGDNQRSGSVWLSKHFTTP